MKRLLAFTLLLAIAATATADDEAALRELYARYRAARLSYDPANLAPLLSDGTVAEMRALYDDALYTTRAELCEVDVARVISILDLRARLGPERLKGADVRMELAAKILENPAGGNATVGKVSIDGDAASLELLRNGTPIQPFHSVRDHGAWHLDFTARETKPSTMEEAARQQGFTCDQKLAMAASFADLGTHPPLDPLLERPKPAPKPK